MEDTAIAGRPLLAETQSTTSEARGLSDKNSGKIVEIHQPESLIKNPQPQETAQLSGAQAQL